MKVIAYTALHYGKDYLAYAIQSIIDHVDEYHVLYSAVGSHGSRTPIPCPETRDELYAIASTVAGSKLRWHDGDWTHEGQQRDSIHQYAPDADVIVVLDADEIWGEGLLPYILNSPSVLQFDVRRWRVPIIHYWRSFHRCVLHDPAFPERVIFPRKPNTLHSPSITEFDENAEGTIEPYPVDGYHFVINHMGYAQRSEIVNYKQLTHGHRGEWRKDDWFNSIFMANRQYDCHPVGSEFWQPEAVNPLDYMPAFMKSHPYYKLEVIP